MCKALMMLLRLANGSELVTLWASLDINVWAQETTILTGLSQLENKIMKIQDLIKNLELKINSNQPLTEQEQLIHKAYWYGRYVASEENHKLIEVIKKSQIHKLK
jgi:hypothetical protein